MTDPIDRLRSALADRYEIVSEIGSGGMATVYLAHDVRHERRVALKVLRSELAATLGPERFLQEVRVTANLQHPHILPLFDSGEADGFLFYVMPYVEGETLRDRLEREGELPVAEVARLMRDVVDALATAHAVGVVHRDIKPENILVSGRHAAVADFGVAKAVTEATGRHQLTTMGVALGTPAYMAPEQAAADDHVDHRADIYAVGAVTYELLTGAPPFSGRSPQQLLAAHVTETPRPVTEGRAAVPPVLGGLVMRCLEKKAADRWQRAEEMLPVLESHVTPSGGTTPTTVTSAPPGRVRAWSRVGVPAVLAAAALAALLGREALVGGAGDSRAVDPDRFAVVPFRVSGADPSLAYLREGMMDLLGVTLSGTASTVETRTVLDAWRRAGGQGDTDPALQGLTGMAAELGAGRVLLGSVVGAPTQLTLNASVYEAPSGRELATASVAGVADELPDLIDRLTAQVVSLEAGEGEDRLAALTTTSLPALRAYLDGMSFYRRGLYEDAADLLVLALGHDSTFATAALYVGEAASMNLTPIPGAGRAGAIVRAHRDRLSPRDRAYSLVLYPDSADGRGVLERWEAAIPRLQDRPEAWYRLGDQLFHNGAMRGVPDFLGRAKEAFSRAVALDSTYFTPVQHLVWIAHVEWDTAFAVRTMRRYLETEGSGPVAEEFRFNLAALEGDTAELARLDGDLQALSDAAVLQLTFGVVGAWRLPAMDPGRAARAARELLRRATTPAERSSALGRVFFVERNGGRPGAAEAVLTELASVPDSGALADRRRIHGAVYWDGDRSSAGAAAARLRGAPSQASTVIYPVATWDLATDASADVGVAIARLRSTGSVTDSLRARVLEVRSAHLRDDPAVMELAIALEVELRRGRANNQLRSHGNLTLVEVFEARGDTVRALAASRRVLWNIDGDRYASTFARAEGRLAKATGDLGGAARAYERYLLMRPDPEAALRPEVDSVRAEVAELRARIAGGAP